MSVSDQPSRNDDLGNGATVAFAYTFRILSKNGIKVLVDGVTLVVDTDYAVSGIGDSGGGTITFVTAPADGVPVTRLRNEPFDQPSVYAANEAFPSARVEKDFDKALMRAQQLREQLSRVLTLPETEAGMLASVTMPSLTARASKLFGWDASGNPIPTLGSTTDQAIAAAAAAAISETDAATSASAASDSAAAAAFSALSATTLQGTSASSVLIATGSQSFTTQAGKQFNPGVWLMITSNAGPTNYFHGQVTSYSGTALVVNVTDIGGSGTFADWTITVSGTRGTAGATGATGPAASAGTLTQGTPLTMDPYVTGTVGAAGHGLSAHPHLVVVFLEVRPAQTDGSYVAGDRIYVQNFSFSPNNEFSVSSDIANLYVVTGSALPFFANKITGAEFNIVATKWKLVAVPYKLN